MKSKPVTLATRLTLWYTAASTLLFLLVASIVYYVIAAVLTQQVDDDLEEDIEDFDNIYITQGIETLWSSLLQEATEDGANQILFRLYSNEGVLINSSDRTVWNDLPPMPGLADYFTQESDAVLSSVHLDGHEHPARMIYAVIGDGNTRIILQVVESLEEREDLLEMFRLSIVLALPLLIFLSFAAGWFMVRRSLYGVEEVTNTAIDISNGALSERVTPGDRGEEIERLSGTFNSMLDKIQALIRGMREMNDNIAHDLKSPLARIRGIAETTLTGDQNQEQYHDLAANTIEECDRLLHLINTMLDLAETEAGLGSTMTLINLTALVREACELYQPLATDHGINLDCSHDAADVSITGNRQFLQRLIGNMLDNAIKYTEPEGVVSISQQIENQDVLIKIADTGQGISHDELPNIFERFYRCDSSRTKPGTGLGLSLALAIAKAHFGNIKVESNPKQGSLFTVSFPLASSVHSRQDLGSKY